MLYSKVNECPYQPLAIFWIFPYFNEKQICDEMPAMEMTDYKVNYMNHNVFSNNGNSRNRKLGSPVRLFTNLCANLIRLPSLEYRFCTICQRYSALENRHCSLCNTCPSRNGSTYRHCIFCDKCVKPTYSHCFLCRRCTLDQDHSCDEFQSKQVCWICTCLGHIERNCPLLPEGTSTDTSNVYTRKLFCYLCKVRNQHNEKKCPNRAIVLENLMRETI